MMNMDMTDFWGPGVVPGGSFYAVPIRPNGL